MQSTTAASATNLPSKGSEPYIRRAEDAARDEHIRFHCKCCSAITSMTCKYYKGMKNESRCNGMAKHYIYLNLNKCAMCLHRGNTSKYCSKTTQARKALYSTYRIEWGCRCALIR